MDLRKKSIMTSFDVKAVVDELNTLLIEKIIDNVYQIEEKAFLIKLTPGDLQLIIEPEKRIHFTKYKIEVPKEPSQFCKELRKHLRQSRIKNISQYKFERVVVIDISSRNGNFQLIAEIFRRGNLILTNENQEIITAFYFADMKDRRIARGELLKQAPTSGIEPQEVKVSDIFIEAERANTLFKKLHKILPFPPTYITEVLYLLAFNETTTIQEIGDKSQDIIEKIKNLYNIHQQKNYQPQIIYDSDNNELDVTPIPLEIYKNHKSKMFSTFNEALDEYFSHLDLEKIKQRMKSSHDVHVDELNRIINSLHNDKKKIEEEINHNTEIGNLILEKTNRIQEILAPIVKYETLANSKNINEEQIIDLDGKNKKVKVKLDDHVFWLNYKDNYFKNAGKYFDTVKELRKKLVSIESTLRKHEQDLQKAELKVAQEKKIEPILVVKRKKEWYEKFRWFRSSDDFLVLIGRDAGTNQLLIDRYTVPDDIVFHADIHGAPFTVIKTEGKSVPQRTLQEAAIAAASYSRAWSSGYSSVDVYWVKPEQLSKKPPSGEYIGKGMFMIYGSRNYNKGVKLGLAIGVFFTEDSLQIIGGPVEAVKSKTSTYVEIIPSNIGHKRFAQEILKKLQHKTPKESLDKLKKLDINDLQSFIPAGRGDFSKSLH